MRGTVTQRSRIEAQIVNLEGQLMALRERKQKLLDVTGRLMQLEDRIERELAHLRAAINPNVGRPKRGQPSSASLLRPPHADYEGQRAMEGQGR